MVQTSVYQGVRCFAAMDLVGSTAMKLHGTPRSSETRQWPDIIRQFYELASVKFLSGNLPVATGSDAYNINLHVWKVQGDEILFYSDRLSSHEQFTTVFIRLYRSLRQVHEYFRRDKLGVKATIWAAGFPRRNKEILISAEAPYFRFITGPFDSKARYFTDTPFLELDQRLDFLGPEIDLGFRLGGHVGPGRIVCSFDVAFFLAANYSRLVMNTPVQVHHVGWARLKGMYGERPYPIFWLDGRPKHEMPVAFSVYEAAESSYAHRFLEQSSRVNEELPTMYQQYVKESDGAMTPMYITENDRMPEEDQRVYRSLRGVDDAF